MNVIYLLTFFLFPSYALLSFRFHNSWIFGHAKIRVFGYFSHLSSCQIKIFTETIVKMCCVGHITLVYIHFLFGFLEFFFSSPLCFRFATQAHLFHVTSNLCECVCVCSHTLDIGFDSTEKAMNMIRNYFRLKLFFHPLSVTLVEKFGCMKMSILWYGVRWLWLHICDTIKDTISHNT